MSFRIVAVGIVATTSLVVAGIVTTNGVSDASGGSDAPGHVLSVHERPGGGFDVQYLSTGVSGGLVEESAVVWLPARKHTGNVVAWAHQTTGIADQCASYRDALLLTARQL